MSHRLVPAFGAGAAAPLLCAAHCVAAPVLVVAAPAVAENRAVEALLILVTLAVGASAAVHGFRLHGNGRVWAPVLVAAALFAAPWVGEVEGGAERLVVVLGSLSVLVALGWDARLRRGCACPTCDCTSASPEAGQAGSPANLHL